MNQVYERKRGNTRWHPVGQEDLWHIFLTTPETHSNAIREFKEVING